MVRNSHNCNFISTDKPMLERRKLWESIKGVSIRALTVFRSLLAGRKTA